MLTDKLYAFVILASVIQYQAGTLADKSLRKDRLCIKMTYNLLTRSTIVMANVKKFSACKQLITTLMKPSY